MVENTSEQGLARPIRRLLIANRGEIAVRIARTARTMGIGTVGVYSAPDALAMHVDVVDRAIALPGSSPAETYLRGDLILEAARRTGADAIHPGYGFLAESAEFARAVIAAGLTWVGPTPEQISLLGDKVAAKRVALEAGLPTTEVVEVRDGETPVVEQYPVLVKAAAGGGGRGMRVVESATDLADAVREASREALSAFGDGTVFIEPFIARGRHIEVQVLGDRYGNAVHLFDRECSIQRRNQKVIEEAPSVGIGPELRDRLCDGALALVRAVRYEGAGTVEFFVGDDGTVTFLEVNTRLQVEHPVTEAITGLDLVELQLRIAAGEPLPVSQQEITCAGHAIEVRVVAEDPSQDWLPTTGLLQAFLMPGDLRVDTGFRSGDVVSHEYDSLLAKVIVHERTRQQAAAVLASELRTSTVHGVATNLAALTAILEEPDYIAGQTYTSYLDHHPEVVTRGGPDGIDHNALLLAAACVALDEDRAANPHTAFAPPGWRNLRVHGERQRWHAGAPEGQTREVELLVREENVLEALIGPVPEPTETGALAPDERVVAAIRVLRRRAGEIVLEIDGERQVFQVSYRPDRVAGTAEALVTSSSGSTVWHRPPRFVAVELGSAGGAPRAPLPGILLSVEVAVGDVVGKGQALVVLEAMKMEHKLTADGPGVVLEVTHRVGEFVEAGEVLVVLGPLEGADV